MLVANENHNLGKRTMFAKTTKKFFLAFLLAGYFSAAYAAGSGKNEQSIVIDGTITKLKAQKSGQRVLVDLKDLARELNWKVQTSQSVTSIQRQEKIAEITPVTIPAKISGALVYYFNRNFGSKPDTGSTVLLVEQSEEFQPEDDDFVLPSSSSIVWKKKGAATSVDVPVKYATAADGNGRYEFSAVSPGTYTLVMKSAHSKGMGMRNIMGKWYIVTLTVKNGDVVDRSHDFGMSDH
ncbi:carboxypeptidase-like regulatory domain-containing protein [Massilia sp.]|uniref:carboxypeptidase-like regulatory domain-containing protein n=1 Tax=Massilia sp. TaxID=1882437 RepID=UPI00391DB824